MRQTFVLTFIADDRPGLVDRLSQAVIKAGGNWLESRLAHLSGKFAGIARIEIPDDRVMTFKDALAALETEGFRLTIEETTVVALPGAIALTIDLVGQDQPGIVHQISRCLAERGLSVEEMETDIREAPMGGGTLFYAKVGVRGPANLDQEDLRQALERLSAALMIDIKLHEASLSP